MKKLLESEPIRYSTALENEYKRVLRGLVDKMVKDTTKVLVNIYADNKGDFALDGFNDVDDELSDVEKKYRKIFERQGAEVAKRMVMRQLRYSKTKIKSVLNKLIPDAKTVPSLKGSIIPKDVEQVIKASILENVSLIKSIHQKYFEQVTGSIARSMQAGGSIEQLRKQILKYNGMTKRRADNIAYDQTRKTFMSINLRNMKQAGIKKAEWIHSGGGQSVREYHYRKWDGVSGKRDGRPNGLNGFIFDIDKPPVIQHQKGSQQEVRGYPAQLPNCKCIMKAVIEFDDI